MLPKRLSLSAAVNKFISLKLCVWYTSQKEMYQTLYEKYSKKFTFPTPIQWGGGYNRFSPAFALPTLVITATILMITAVSVAQTTASITANLRSRSYNSLANEAAEAGVSYAYSCLKKNGTSYWTSPLKPNTSCTGSSNGNSAYLKDQAASGDIPHYRSSFTVAPPDSNNHALAEGKVELVDSAGTVTKTWVSDKVVVVSVIPNEVIRAVKLVKTDMHTCVLASDSQVYCAGNNAYGELGDGTFTNRSTPVKFKLPTGLTALDLAVGGSGACDTSSCVEGHPHTCVLASDSQVYCAGYNSVGQLGDGSTTNRSTPVKFQLPAGHTAAAGPSIGAHEYYTHTCVITNGAEVYCAGDNYRGELGIGNQVDQHTPVRFGVAYGQWGRKLFTSGDNSTGGGTTCIYTGQVYCAGWNQNGQFGTGGSGVTPTPGLAFNGWGVQDFSLSPETACVLGTAGNILCAGSDGYGQMGDVTSGGNKVSPVSFGNNYSKVVASAYITCGITYVNTLNCAGYDYDGQFADNGASAKSTPSGWGIPGGYWVKDVAVSELAVCILGDTTRHDLPYGNQVYCAGRDSYGGFGNGSTGNFGTAQRFQLPAGLYAKQVYMDNAQYQSYFHICVLATDDQIYCAGRNQYGQLGNGSTGSKTTPVKFQLPS